MGPRPQRWTQLLRSQRRRSRSDGDVAPLGLEFSVIEEFDIDRAVSYHILLTHV